LSVAVGRETFENIHLDLSKQSGRCRLAESGLGWKPSGGSDPFTLDNNQIAAAQWSRASKGYELKIITRDAAVIQLDGFDQEDFERAAKAFKIWYGINLENREHALRGWNWGKAEFGRAELAFSVQNRPAFEIPYSEISNTNLAGKNEIAVEFNLGPDPTQNGANGNKAGGTKNRGRKAAAGRDELVEMRFYIPGTVSKKDVNGDEGSGAEDQEEEEEQNAANLFYETLMDKADIGEVAGATFATFQDILHLTPRYVKSQVRGKRPNPSTEADSTLTCMKTLSAYAAKLTTTKFNTNPSRSFSSYRRTTKSILSSHSDLILPFDKVRRGIHSSLCNSNLMMRSTWIST
jgi:structure-specific recognition protein 1